MSERSISLLVTVMWGPNLMMEIAYYSKNEILQVDLYQIDIAMTTSAIRKKLINFIADADD